MACIWYVSKYVTPPNRGSAGNRGFLLMREFARLGHRSVILTSDSNHLAKVPDLGRDAPIESIDGVELHWLRTLKYKTAKSLRRILSWLDFEWQLLRLPARSLPRPDVVIVSSLSLLTLLNGLLMRRRHGARLVFEIRDIWPLTLVEEGGFSRWNPLVMALAWIERTGYARADAVVGTMPNLREHVREVLGREREVACIPMGIEPGTLESQQPLPAHYVERHVPQGKFIVAHAGSIGITNALEPFFECARAMQHDAQVHFLMVGDGDLRAHYEQAYGMLPNLSFAPKVAKQQVLAVLAECDLLYFSVHRSAVWRFGQSLNKVIDYMLAGKPVVASYTGYPSMINEAGCGSYVPAGDVSALRREVERYAAMPAQERQSIGRKGRDWILAHRSYPRLAQDYLRVLGLSGQGASPT